MRPKENFFRKLTIFPSLGRGKVKYAAGLILLVIFYYLVVSDRLLVTELTLAGNNQVSYEQVKSVLDAAANNRLLLMRQNHYLLMTRGRVNRMVTKSIPEVREVVRVNRTWSNQIEIEIAERNPGFVLSVRDRKFLVDEGGVVLKEVIEENGLPLVFNQSQEDEVVVGELLSNAKMVAFILSMHRTWDSKMEAKIAAIKIPSKGSYEVQFTAASGWTAFFDVNRPVAVQLESLSVILNKQIAAKDKARLAYVDMRSEKWVYYCFTGSACAQQPVNNLQGEPK